MGARDMGGKAVGTGATVLMDGWAEIKRMWVEEEARGRGIARKILDALLAVVFISLRKLASPGRF